MCLWLPLITSLFILYLQNAISCIREFLAEFRQTVRPASPLLYVHRSEVAYWGRGRGGLGSTADTARKRPERPWTAARTMEVFKAVSPCHCAATSALRNCCFNCRAGQSYKDNVRCTAVEEQLERREVQLSQPSSISLLMISSGLT